MSALLAIYGVTGADRDRLMTMARTPDEPSWLDKELTGLTVDSVTLASYEADATRITDWSPLLVPGLLQTMEYTRAFMLADDLPDGVIGSRLMARQRRQDVLGRVHYTAFLDESVLHRQVGGPKVLAHQLRRLIELADESAITVRVLPGGTGGHPGLAGPFLLLEYPTAAPIVHVELCRSGVFLTGPDDADPYLRSVERLSTLALDAGQSRRLLVKVAAEIEGGTS